MPRRISPFVSNGYYHVFNRGVNKSDIYLVTRDYNQMLLSTNYYRFKNPSVKLSRLKLLSVTKQSQILAELESTNNTLVDIMSFVFMPNHFHFLLKQNVDFGVSKFISQLTNSYTRYYNTSHNRTGHLFQGQFKSVEIESEDQLIHVSRYIHLNPYVSRLISKKTLDSYIYSSYLNYVSTKANFVNCNEILNIVGSKKSYEDFVIGHADYARELEIIKHQTIDID